MAGMGLTRTGCRHAAGRRSSARALGSLGSAALFMVSPLAHELGGRQDPGVCHAGTLDLGSPRHDCLPARAALRELLRGAIGSNKLLAHAAALLDRTGPADGCGERG